MTANADDTARDTARATADDSAPTGEHDVPDTSTAHPADMSADVARVDLQADPSRWLPNRALVIVTAVAILAAAVTVLVCLLIWWTPAMHPVDLPSVPKG